MGKPTATRVADMRKFHNKSKLGCKQCKTRRIKCDEARPLCRKCAHASLECSFLLDDVAKRADTQTHITPTSEKNCDEVQAACAKGQHTALSSLSVSTRPVNSQPLATLDMLDERFSALHIRLWRHFEHDFYQHQKELYPGLDELVALFLDTSLTTPYLLDGLLAYAAVHKSTVYEFHQSSYLLEAKRLQTRALALYNSERPVLSDETCLPMFLFSSLLSHHTMFEVRLEGQEDLRLAVDAITQSIPIQRGLHAIARAAWPMFTEQTQQTFIRSCQRETALVEGAPRPTEECDALLAHLERASFGPLYKHMCCSAVTDLQKRFNALSMGDTHSSWAAIQDWLVAVPAGYVELLKSFQPEALVILAYFAVLLHYGAEHWFIGDLGVRLISLISENLGPHWREWLEWPIRATMDRPNPYRGKD
ncbi:hypothetical protein JDV02_003474 [Purpureocillium takamizusanense]|uniref:Zn(2)-C6 fungal-type domain-containing protein n=1 Tax=Purpureocillium takamizusanense TaxID=2060973 RepID=A0A9Q8QCY5_9HYPO|nr:uncharacterized protein JDV02_003474 [Purpureocillium takamizusanense]UNI17098.1 hypothetical protein JDV02_003474 [Purpureocillium takamizusanense]